MDFRELIDGHGPGRASLGLVAVGYLAGIQHRRWELGESILVEGRDVAPKTASAAPVASDAG